MKLQLILIAVVLILTSCGVVDSLEIPLTEKEITFFDQLNHHPLTIDSVTRNININSLMWHKYKKSVLINLYSYSTEDSLTVKEWDVLSDKIADFYSRQEIEGVIFTYCSINYLRLENQNSKDYFYDYNFVNGKTVCINKSYELKEE